jgi:hypothetical protein
MRAGDVADEDLRDLLGMAPQPLRVHFRVILAAVADKDEAPLGISSQDGFDCRRLGLAAGFKEPCQCVIAEG